MAIQRRWVSVLIVLMLLGLLAAVFFFSNQRKGTAVVAAASPATTTVTDLLGRKVHVRVPVQRVILGEGRQLYLAAALDTEDPIQRIMCRA